MNWPVVKLMAFYSRMQWPLLAFRISSKFQRLSAKEDKDVNQWWDFTWPDSFAGMWALAHLQCTWIGLSPWIPVLQLIKDTRRGRTDLVSPNILCTCITSHPVLTYISLSLQPCTKPACNMHGSTLVLHGWMGCAIPTAVWGHSSLLCSRVNEKE